MRTVAFSAAKGGVGKTTLSVHVAVGAALAGHRVLLVDLDSQLHSTKWLLPALLPDARGVFHALQRGDTPLEEELHQVPGREGLWVLPGTEAMLGADVMLAEQMGGELQLRTALAGLQGRFDVVVLDCPPNLGLCTINALCAADVVFVPVTASYLALDVLGELKKKMEAAKKRLGARGKVAGHVLFAANASEAITQQTRDLLAETGLLLEAEVRVSTNNKALPGVHLTAWDKGEDARGAEDYPVLLAEVLERAGASKRRAAGRR